MALPPKATRAAVVVPASAVEAPSVPERDRARRPAELHRRDRALHFRPHALEVGLVTGRLVRPPLPRFVTPAGAQIREIRVGLPVELEASGEEERA
jgi:hypothetical protein